MATESLLAEDHNRGAVPEAVPAPAPPQARLIQVRTAAPLDRATLLRAAAAFGLEPTVAHPPRPAGQPVCNLTPEAVPGHRWQRPLRSGSVQISTAAHDTVEGDSDVEAPMAASLTVEARPACVLPLDVQSTATPTPLPAAVSARGSGPPGWVLDAVRSLDVPTIVFQQLDVEARNAVRQLGPRWRDSLLHACVFQPHHWPDLSATVRAEANAASDVLLAAGMLANAAGPQTRLTNCELPGLPPPRA